MSQILVNCRVIITAACTLTRVEQPSTEDRRTKEKMNEFFVPESDDFV
ncbi:hypothetical protein HanXRQr2_Chr10g0428171 [Helianthus annuus]|uniref:Uncharacterized protein n=1 Tax=Helianthus annuus TaxID=4232 RepID=A0A9K3HVU4_HELAN|nr:hypothetical protein HanXRQr2_Chr10g0428171 [Helianthus annuus]